MLNVVLGKKIKSLRIHNNMTQTDVANALNMSQSAYSRMERGETSAWIMKVENIYTLYNISLQDLL